MLERSIWKALILMLQTIPLQLKSPLTGIASKLNAPIGSVLEIYSVVGIKVKEIQMKQSSGEYVVNIAKGYYIIRIADTVRKVAIR